MLKKSSNSPLIHQDHSNKKSRRLLVSPTLARLLTEQSRNVRLAFSLREARLRVERAQKNAEMAFLDGGENRIRTCERLATLHAFQACSFNHSDTSPAPPILPHFPPLVIHSQKSKLYQF